MNPLSPASPKPSWLRVKAPVGNNYSKLSNLIKKERLHTVCSSASCPNVGECWNAGTATFMILGNICTRACRFCHVKSAKSAQPVDLDEPRRLAETIQKMALKHAVITSVTRDDLADYGATHFKNCLEFIKKSSQNITAGHTLDG